jgi:anti-anti-sigma factor
MIYSKPNAAAGELVLEVEGSLTGQDAEEFQKRLDEITVSEYNSIVLDLKKTVAINSACIGRILLARRKLEESGSELRINGCSPAVYDTLKSINLDKIVPIEP